MYKFFVLFSFVVILCIGSVKAADTEKPASNMENYTCLAEKTSIVLNDSSTGNEELYFIFDPTIEESLFYNLIYQNKFSFDSINPNEFSRCYLKNLFPIIKRVDLDEIELIEIL